MGGGEAEGYMVSRDPAEVTAMAEFNAGIRCATPSDEMKVDSNT